MMNPHTVARWKKSGYLFEEVASERFLALVAVRDPFWFRPLCWVVYKLPECWSVPLTQRLDHWQTDRAVRLYRERKGQR